MKHGYLLLGMFFVFVFSAFSQTVPVREEASNDGAVSKEFLELAKDAVDATDLMAEVLDKPDVIYEPAKRDAEKALQKMRRAMASQGEKSLYNTVSLYPLPMFICRSPSTYRRALCPPDKIAAARVDALAHIERVSK